MINKTVGIIVGILLFLSPLVVAQEIEADAGITPDQGFLWRIDVAFERIQMVLTRNNETKVNLGLRFAEERLAEMKMMANQNKIQFMIQAEDERSRIVDEVEKNMAKGLTEEHKEFVLARLQKHLGRLEEVKEKAPEQARERLANAIQKSSQVLEKIRLRINEDLVCCKIYGLGAYMEQVNIHYELLTKSECSVPTGFVGGGREIIDNSYCK